MKIEVTARRLAIEEKAKDTIEKRLGKLAKVLPREADAKVVVRPEKRGFLVEVTITARQRTWAAEAVAADQLTAVQNALDKVAAQAKKTKARVKEEKKHTVSAVRSPAAAVPPEKPVPPREKPPKIESYEARRMFDEDALQRFDRGKREILAYRDPSSGEMRVVYRRKDGTVVILTPS
jgi:putative sigma-54 modulation protein